MDISTALTVIAENLEQFIFFFIKGSYCTAVTETAEVLLGKKEKQP